MQFLLILVICLAFLPGFPGETNVDPSRTFAATALSVVLVGVMAELLAGYVVWQLARDPGRRRLRAREFQRLRFLHFLLALVLYVVVLIGAGWGLLVREVWQLQGMILIDELLVLSPLLGMLVWTWMALFRAEKAFHHTGQAAGIFWKRGPYLVYHLRNYLGLVLTPILIFTVLHDALLLVLPDNAHRDWLELTSLVALMLAVLLAMPWLLTLIWGTRSLPPGPLRSRLGAAARRLRFRFTDVLVWDTHGNVVNAMVTGLFRFPRYVLLSDALIRDLTPEEIEAVFGHEVGHVKHHHMALYLAFLVLSLSLLSGLHDLMMPWSGPMIRQLLSEWLPAWPDSGNRWTLILASIPALGVYIYLVFGFLSRRCERQADIYGCVAASGAESACQDQGEMPPTSSGGRPLSPTGIKTFISALEKVALLNGMDRERHSWRHASIARRVTFLQQILQDRAVERHFQSRLSLVKWGLLIGLIVATLALGGVGLFSKDDLLHLVSF